MKLEFELEGTPEEFRRLLGLPDADAMAKLLARRMEAHIAAMGPEELTRFWTGGDMMRRMSDFWLAAAAPATKPKTKPKKK